jgi:hypothetical protein
VPGRSLASLSRGFAVLLTLLIALVTVGLTASSDGPLSIAIRPEFLRLGIDVDVKIGSLHLHAGWSALPAPLLTPTTPTTSTTSTKPDGQGL